MPRVHGRIWIQTQIGLAPNLGFFHSSALGINEALLVQDLQKATQQKENWEHILECES